MANHAPAELLARLDTLTPQELKRYLVQELTRKRLGLVWEADLIERDKALNANLVFPELDVSLSRFAGNGASSGNLIIEGDNFDSLRLLKATHAGKIRVILIDPPYNTGNKDWVYNDDYVSKEDRWKHSTWLEFMYQRMVLARDLLAPDGVILICINDENRSRLELMMDEVMPGRRLGSMVWRTRQGSNDTKSGNLSGDHEHILVYANHGFMFAGMEKSYAMYSNPDNDPRGDWRIGDITCSKGFKERPNLYFPVVDPAGIHYPPNPDSTWRYQQSTMSEYLALGQIVFPANQTVRLWPTMSDLLADIDAGNVPLSGKKPLLRRDLPNLEWWVGVPVGFGRPQFKRYKADLKNTHQPLSSWIIPKFEDGEYDSSGSFVSTTNHEGASGVADIFGSSRVFNYAKPLTLIQQLLSQATRPGDTVLDFFAGSGTTGHAVLALNAEDGGNRKFILCSSTEATKREPDKNLCRDVCAERIRRVMDGYGKTEGLGGDFAYLRLARIEEADLVFDALPVHAYNLLCLRENGAITPADPKAPFWLVASSDGSAAVVCPAVTETAVNALKALQVNRLVVYTDRPDSLCQLFEGSHVDVSAYPLEQALRWAQTARTSPVAVEVLP